MTVEFKLIVLTTRCSITVDVVVVEYVTVTADAVALAPTTRMDVELMYTVEGVTVTSEGEKTDSTVETVMVYVGTLLTEDRPYAVLHPD